jgi:hypothetical protein
MDGGFGCQTKSPRSGERCPNACAPASIWHWRTASDGIQFDRDDPAIDDLPIYDWWPAYLASSSGSFRGLENMQNMFDISCEETHMAATLVERHPDAVSAFVQSLQEPRTPYISPKRFSHALGVQVVNLAALAGVHRNTLRNPASERLQDKLREMVKVISAAADLTGDISKAIFWYRNEPIADYEYKTAAELVAEGHAEAVMAHLRDLENGASG